jgi:PPM family protein phosphatase
VNGLILRILWRTGNFGASQGDIIVSLLRALFGKDKASSQARSAAGAAEPSAKNLEVSPSILTDVGCVRENNEDRVLFDRPDNPQLLISKGVLTLVADGMGGCSGGELASSKVAESVPRSYFKSELEPHEALKQAFEKANQEVYKAAAEDPALAGMGTTGVALAIRGNQAFAAYVGDSRLYLIRCGKIYQMTEDHSVVFDMWRQGLISPEEARNHEDRNVLTRSLGGRPEVDVSVWNEPLTVLEEDRFLLCSDGLHDLVEDREMLEVVEGQAAESAVVSLIGMAKQRGGYDNVTVALLRVHGPNGVTPPDTALQEIKVTREIPVAEEPDKA